MTHPGDARRQSPVPRWALDRRSALKLSGGSIAATVLGGAHALDTAAQDDNGVALQFLTSNQYETVAAIAEQFWPTTDASPGGRDAGVADYIDRALAGAYNDYQDLYHAGLGWIDLAANQHGGENFVELDAEQQLALLTAIFDESFSPDVTGAAATPTAATPMAATPDAEEATPVASPVAQDVDEGGASRDVAMPIVAGLDKPQAATLLAFLNVVRVHTMEGLFSDPSYGGNRDFAGWRAVGYPGPYVFYNEEQQQSFEPLDQPLQSIADL
jgi:gluconate 2-dehydrogenase gamma chain